MYLETRKGETFIQHLSFVLNRMHDALTRQGRYPRFDRLLATQPMKREKRVASTSSSVQRTVIGTHWSPNN